MNATHEPAEHHREHDDEIDLWELVVSLWHGKLWIGLTIGLFAVAGLSYAKLATENWRAEAQISQPRYADYQPLGAEMQSLRPAFGDTYDQQVAKLGLESPQAAYERFTNLYDSADNRRAFLQQHPLFLQAVEKAAETGNVTEETNGADPAARALNRWSERLSYSASEDNPSAAISAEASNAADSARLLRDYVDYTNRQLLHEWQIGLQSLIRSRRQELEQTRSELQDRTRDRITSDIRRLNHSLAIARAADVMNPLVDPGTEDEFAINLGAPAIEAKIKQLQSIEELSVLEPELARLEASLEALNRAEPTKPDDFKAYQYRMSPSEPVDRESPRTLLILAACVFMGGVLGSIGVLIAHAIRNHRSESAPDA